MQDASKPYVIGIAGGSASGKTVVINDLRSRFLPGEIAVLSQDNYYRDRGMQVRDEKGEVNFDLPGAIEGHALEKDLCSLIAGHPVVRKEYTFNNPEAEPGIVVVEPASILVVEGLFVFHFAEVARLLDLKVYIDAREEIKLNRRIHRDALERGYPESDVRYRWQHHVMPAYRKYLLPYRDVCDLVLVNNDRYATGLSVLESHMRSFIGEKAQGLTTPV